jgi:hypothetical protein
MGARQRRCLQDLAGHVSRRSLISMCGLNAALTIDWSEDGQADLFGTRFA